MRSALSEDLLDAVIRQARAAGRGVLLEHEGYRLLAELGIRTPRHSLVTGAGGLTAAELRGLGSGQVVVKAVSAGIAHKSELGAVKVVQAEMSKIDSALSAMAAALPKGLPEGFLVCEFIPHRDGFADQLLLGARWTEDFGPVVTLGPGGVEAEFLARAVRPGEELALFSPEMAADAAIDSALERAAVTRLAAQPWRGKPPRLSLPDLRHLVQVISVFAERAFAAGLDEFEINPLALTPDGPVALDFKARLASERSAVPPERPRDQLRRLLQPRTIAILGVSERPNPGHIIVRNTLEAGFDPSRLWIVKPGRAELLGCPCVADVASLPQPVDLMILAVGAPQVPEIVAAVIDQRLAESLIVIPGGLGEHRSSGGLARDLRRLLHESRALDWRGPVINGANCLGVRSRPGGYDTLFIPSHKLPVPEAPESPLALISQSGAFAVAQASKLSRLNPRYIVTTGNQLDLTVGDYLEELAGDEEIRVFACYVEGFQPLDGARLLRAARRIVASGRAVVLYRAGRTPAGASASASHTASVAGDYVVTRELARQAGVVVADTLDDFEDLVGLFVGLEGRVLNGRSLGAMSNAGFECVAMADNLRSFVLADFEQGTMDALTELLEASRLTGIVEVRNPLDTTPMMADGPFAAAASRVLNDPGVDLGLIGCVPLTAAMNTLEAGEHNEDVDREDSVAGLLIALWRATEKPWAAVVDSGPLYDPLASRLLDAGLPTFRCADRALRLLERWAAAQLPAV